MIQTNVCFLLTFVLHAITAAGQIMPVGLKCEYLVDPLAIDELQPRLCWRSESAEDAQYQTQYEILVASSPENLEMHVGDLWASGMVRSGKSVNILYDGRPLKSFDQCWWKVRIWDSRGNVSPWSSMASWGMGVLNESDWRAQWINRGTLFLGGQVKVPMENTLNCAKLRKTFHLPEMAVAGKAYINALGFYELYVNGRKVGKDILSPAVSDYAHHSLYVAYDITSYLRPGANSVGIWLAPGWYRRDVRDYYGVAEPVPLVRARFNLRLQSGEELLVRTDRTWKVRLSERAMHGKWIWGDFGGEHVDASKAEDDWSSPEYDDSHWELAYNYKPPRVPALAQRCPPTVKLTEYPVQSIDKLGPASYLVDFGTVMTGWVELHMRDMVRGDTVALRYADKIIHPDEKGDPLEMHFTIRADTDPMKRRFVTYNQEDIYLAAGLEEEIFINKFNYHAFRWVLVEGLDHLQADDIGATMIGTDLEQVSTVETSNPLLNDVWQLINHTFRCLTHTGYVVDCPHRERIGYGGDMHASLETSLCNFGLSSFFNKWMIDWRVNMYPTGLWASSAPEPPQHNYAFNPGWGSLGIAMPWRYYMYYGDTINLRRSYPHVTRYIEYLTKNVVDGILYPDTVGGHPGRGFLGDWVPPGYDMTKDGRIDDHSSHLFNNCIYIYDLRMAGKMAQVLGETEDALRFQQMIEHSKGKIHEFFFNPERGDYANGQQPYLAFPLLTGIVPEQHIQSVSDQLERLILVINEGHLQSGMLGTHFLFEHLTQEGRNDLVYTMVNQDTWPGWGYMLEQGATTVWEQWNGHNSQVHNCYLGGGAWFVRGLGGIRPDENRPGMQHFLLKPAVLDDLRFSRVRYQSLYGTVVCNWIRSGDSVVFDVHIPCNTYAEFTVPETGHKSILVNGERVDVSDRSTLNLRSGRYSIELR